MVLRFHEAQRGVWIGFSVLVLVVIAGCASLTSGQGGDTASATAAADGIIGDTVLDNRIRVAGHGIALPAGWEYGPGIGDGVPFTFRWSDAGGGQFEVFDWDPDLSYERFVEYFRERIFPAEQRLAEGALSSERFGDVLVFTGETDDRSLISLVARERGRVLLIHIRFDPADAINAEGVLRLLESYDYSPEQRDFRIAPGRIGFVATDTDWRWSADVNDGVYVRYTGGPQSLTVGFWSVDANAAIELESDRVEIAVPPIVPRLRGAQGPVRVFEAHGTRLDEYYVLYHRDGEQSDSRSVYVLRIAHPRSDDRTAEATLATPALQELLDFSLVYPPMEVTP